MTVRELLRGATEGLRAGGSESARLDAELLLAHALGVDRTKVLAHPELVVGDGPAARFAAALARRATGEPVAYIRGTKEFHGHAFHVDARALIPRPETELLVDLGIERVREALAARPRGAGRQPLLCWDVGTGSGAVAIAVLRAVRRLGYRDAVRFLATDVSADAVALAAHNAADHGVADEVDFTVADIRASAHGGARLFDVVLANLPYVPTADVPGLPIAASFEPRAALDGGPDGLDLVRRLLDRLPGELADDGCALLEIGDGQDRPATTEAAKRMPGRRSVIHRDLCGRARVLEVLPAGRPAEPPGRV